MSWPSDAAAPGGDFCGTCPSPLGDQPKSFDQLPDTDRYNVDDVDYGVEFVDEGLRIVQQNVDIHASSEQVIWLRGLAVVDSSDPAGAAG